MGRKRKDLSVPITEARLQDLQAKFLADRADEAVMKEFFCLMKDYARSFVLQQLKKTKKGLTPERVDEIATEMVVKTFEQYKKHSNWRVAKSFGGQLKCKMLEAMYGPKEEEKQNSLNERLKESEKEVVDMLSDSQGVVPWNPDNSILDPYDPVDSLMLQMNVVPEETDRLLDAAYEALPYKTYIVFLCWLLLKLRKPKTRNITENFKKTVNLTSQEEEAFEYLLLEMKHRIENQLIEG